MSSYRKIHLHQQIIKPIQNIPIENYKIIQYKKNTKFNIKMCICIHCYNINIFNELMYYITNFFEFNWKRLKIIIHYVHQDINKIKKIIEILCNVNLENTEIFTFIKGDNIGGDIGGFIRSCEYISDDDIVSIIHTKTNKIWRRKMMNIFTKEGIYTSMNLFQTKNNIGSIGTSEKIQNFPNIHNYLILIKSICKICNYNFNINKLLQSNYLSGTIFMCRKNLLNIFIKNRTKYYKLLQNYDLLYSKGKKRPLAGDYEHATELIFGYLIIMNNKKLVGIY